MPNPSQVPGYDLIFDSLDSTKEQINNLKDMTMSLAPFSALIESARAQIKDIILKVQGLDPDQLRMNVENESQEIKDNVDKMIENAEETIDQKIDEIEHKLDELGTQLMLMPFIISSTVASMFPTSMTTTPALLSNLINTYNSLVLSVASLLKVFTDMGVGMPKVLQPLITVMGTIGAIMSIPQQLISTILSSLPDPSEAIDYLSNLTPEAVQDAADQATENATNAQEDNE